MQIKQVGGRDAGIAKPRVRQARIGQHSPSFRRAAEIFGERLYSGQVGGGVYAATSPPGGSVVVTTAAQLRTEAAIVDNNISLAGDAVIDMTGEAAILVEQGVTIHGARGLGGLPGALLYYDETLTDGATENLFETHERNVTFSGLRLRGGRQTMERDQSNSRGIYSRGRGGGQILTVENCEISQFSHAGVYVYGTLTQTADVIVKDCYIHQCRRNGAGYGISGRSGNIIGEYNVFRGNRHSFESHGNPNDSYAARHNIMLGYHSSHQFDVHGGTDRGEGNQIAGDYFVIENNISVDTGQSIRKRLQVDNTYSRGVVFRGIPDNTTGQTVVNDNYFLAGKAPVAYYQIDGSGGPELSAGIDYAENSIAGALTETELRRYLSHLDYPAISEAGADS